MLGACLGVPIGAALARPAAAAGALAPEPDRQAALAWQAFKARHLLPEGRVVDDANGGISHSEGQGIALLLAVRFDEPALFARCLRWTRAALARPEDMLLAWCHRPGDPGRPADRNNATDGDLLVAWALAEAAARWGQPAHRALAVAMARDILGRLVLTAGDRAVLLPGSLGFETPAALTVNPSYYVYPAFLALRRLLPDPAWFGLEQSGLRLARSARFGRWGLVPDWLAWPRGGGPAVPAPDRPARFSYDALRVPLYLIWGGYGGEPIVAAAARFWHDPSLPQMPAWADLRTDRPAPYAADSGIAAVAGLCAAAGPAAAAPGAAPAGPAVPGATPPALAPAGPAPAARRAALPPIAENYYAAALRLLALLASGAMPARTTLAALR